VKLIPLISPVAKGEFNQIFNQGLVLYVRNLSKHTLDQTCKCNFSSFKFKLVSILNKITNFF